MSQESKRKARVVQPEPPEAKYKFMTVDIDERHKMPIIQLNGQQQFFPYGPANDYADYLIQMYNRSSVHATIVKQKAKFVFGQGFQVKESSTTALRATAEHFLMHPNRTGQYMDDVLERAVMDLELFNGFALEVNWVPDKLGKDMKWKVGAVYHRDWTSLRVNKDETGVWHSNQWTPQQSKYRWKGYYQYALPPDATFYPFFNPDTVGKDCFRQIYYFKVYNAQMKPYPLPEYISCNTDIEADIEISNFDLNNVKTGMSAGGMWVFKNGIPSVEEQAKIERDVKGKMAGSDNAGQILIQFIMDGAGAPEFISFQPNDMADQFMDLKTRVRDAIIVGHQVTNPNLFGIMSEGQLGGRTQIVEAYEQFQNVYVNARQQAIERVFNHILSYHCNSDEVRIEITRTEPISQTLSESVVAGVMTKEEIREKAGLPQLEETKEEKKVDQATLDAQAGLKGTVGGVTGAIEIARAVTEGAIGKNAAVKLLQDLYGFDEETSMLIAGYTADEIAVIKSEKIKPGFKSASFQTEKGAKHLDPQDDEAVLSLFAAYGIEDQEGEDFVCDIHSSEEAELLEKRFHFAGQPLQELYQELEKGPKIPLAKLAERLDTDMDGVIKMLNDLQRLNVLDYETTTKGDKITIKRLGPMVKPVEPEAGYKIEVRYKYFGPEDSRNRPFCAEMLRMNRIFTREEIDAISDKVGYNVWLRRGGWYTDPDTGVARPSCRHTWNQKVIKTKV